MAINDVTLNVGANLGPAQRQLQAFIAQANRQMGRQSFKFSLDDKGFNQPLGRITGNLNQFQGAMDASIARTLAFGASVGVIGGVTKAFKELVATTVNVEHSIKEINVLLLLSTKQLAGFSKELFSVAQNTASSFNTAAEAATEFSRQGLGAAETARRVNDALILARLSGLEAAASVSALTAAVNGFKKEGISTAEVVNRLANVDAAFAVSSADLASALSRAGSVSQDAKVKFNELLAATTAVQQATARGGNVIGNGFKTIFTRLQRSKVRSELEKIGVATTDSTGKIRGAISVLQDYAKVYENLSDQQKAYTSEQVAGVFQINTLKALLGDLSSDTSVYTAALKTANKTTNEAVQRNAELNKTLKSLTSQTGTELQELAAKFGKLGLESNFKGILGVLKGALGEMNKVVDSEGLGGDVARGFISGFGKFITGPGLAIALVGIVKLLKFIGRETAVALKQVLAIGSQSQKRQVVQERVNQLLREDNALLKQILASEGNMVTINNAVAAAIGRQNAALAGQKALVQQISAALALNKAGMLVPTGGRGGGRAPVGRGAEGFVPNMVNRERSSISKGVGGARAGDRPVVIPNFSFGGGKKGTMVAHSGEHIVPNFAGGGSAIFNRDMASSMGLPSGARKISADGFVPSFAGPKGAGAKAGVVSKTKRKKKQEQVEMVASKYSFLIPTEGVRKKKPKVTGSFQHRKKSFAYTLKSLSIAGPDKKQSLKAAGEGGDNLEDSIKKALLDGTMAYAKDLSGSVKSGLTVTEGKIKQGFRSGGTRGAYGASQAAVGSAFEVGTAAALGIKQGKVKKGKADFDIRNLTVTARERLEEIFGPVGGRSIGDFKASDSAPNITNFAKKIAKKQDKLGAAAGGFIPNFAGGGRNVTLTGPYKSGNYDLKAGDSLWAGGALLTRLEAKGAIAATKGKASGKKRNINQADAVYRTKQIVALVSNRMGPKNKYQFGTGGKVAAKFTATGTKNLSGNGPKQVGAIIKPYIDDAADEVFAHMTSKQPQGGIRNIPDGYDKMAGSVFEAAAQKVVRTTQFKSNAGIDVRGMSEERRDLLAGVFNVGSLNEMRSAEIKLGYNKALMKDMVAKIRASKGMSKQKGMIIPSGQQHFPQGVAADGYIPSFANLAGASATPAGKRALSTERSLAGSARMGYDSRVGYGVFNNSQGSLGNAMSQHVNSGDSVSSLGSMGAAAQAAAAAAAAGFVPSYARRVPGFTPTPQASPQQKWWTKLMPGNKGVEKGIAKLEKTNKKGFDDNNKISKEAKGQMMGFMGMMALSTGSGVLEQEAGKRETFAGYQGTKIGADAVHGASVGSIALMLGKKAGIKGIIAGTIIGAIVGAFKTGFKGINDGAQKEADFQLGKDRAKFGETQKNIMAYESVVDQIRDPDGFKDPIQRKAALRRRGELGALIPDEDRKAIIGSFKGTKERTEAVTGAFDKAGRKVLLSEMAHAVPAFEKHMKGKGETLLDDDKEGLTTKLAKLGIEVGNTIELQGKDVVALDNMKKSLEGATDAVDIFAKLGLGDLGKEIKGVKGITPEGEQAFATKAKYESLAVIKSRKQALEAAGPARAEAKDRMAAQRKFAAEAKASGRAAERRTVQNKFQRELDQLGISRIQQMPSQLITDQDRKKQIRGIEDKALEENAQVARQEAQEKFKQAISKLGDTALGAGKEDEDLIKSIAKVQEALTSGTTLEEILATLTPNSKMHEAVDEQIYALEKIETSNDNIEKLAKKGRENEDRMIKLLHAGNVIKSMETGRGTQREVADERALLKRSLKTLVERRGAPGREIGTARDRLLLGAKVEAQQRFVDADLHGANAKQKREAKKKLETDIFELNVRNRVQDFAPETSPGRTQYLDTSPLRDPGLVGKPREIIEDMIPNIEDAIIRAQMKGAEPEVILGLQKLLDRFKDVLDSVKENFDAVNEGAKDDPRLKGKEQGAIQDSRDTYGSQAGDPKKDLGGLKALENFISGKKDDVKKGDGVSDALLQEIRSLSRAITILSGEVKGSKKSPIEIVVKKTNASRGHLPRAAGGNMGGKPLQEAFGRERRDISGGVGGARPGTDQPALIPNFNGSPVVAHTGEYLVDNYSGGKSAIFNREMISSMGMPNGARRIGNAATGKGSGHGAEGYIPNMANVGGLGIRKTYTSSSPGFGWRSRNPRSSHSGSHLGMAPAAVRRDRKRSMIRGNKGFRRRR